jgi:hypothetical protein
MKAEVESSDFIVNEFLYCHKIQFIPRKLTNTGQEAQSFLRSKEFLS